MSEDTRIVTANLDNAELRIPAFGNQPALILDISKMREGESRLHEAQVVNPGTYANLEYVYNEGYREAKRHLSLLGYQVTLAEKAKLSAKSEALLDNYNTFIKEKSLKDSTDIREAFLQTIPEYVLAQDRIDMLKAMESLIDGKVKNFENVCRYMKKQMDLLIRSGVDANKYMR